MYWCRCTCAFVWMVQYLKCRYLRFWSSDSNTSSVKQSDWMIIIMIYKWNRLQGQKEEITKDLDKWTKQTYKTTEQRTTIQDGTIQVNNWTVCKYVIMCTVICNSWCGDFFDKCK